MDRPLRRIIGVYALGSALVLSGCGGSASSDSPDAAALEGGCTSERMGGTATMAMGGQPAGLDPLAINGTPSTGGIELVQIYDTLMQYDPKTTKYEPRVAESLEPNAEFDEWTLKLRPDVAFGNGDPLTAEAVKASLLRSQSEANRGTYRNLALQIAEMEVVDERTLVMTLKQPWAGFPFMLANTPGMIVNTAVAKAAGEGFATDPAGAGVGPYEVKRFARGEELVLSAKDDYWGGPVCIKTLRFIPLPQDSGKYDAFRAGEIEAAWIRDPLTVHRTEKDDVPGIVTYQNAANVLMLNSGVRGSKAPTTDIRIRQAVAHAIDVKAVDKRANEGTGFPTSAILGKKSPYFTGAAGTVFDRAKATALLNQAKGEGYDGSIRLICPKTSEEQGLAIEAQLEAAGFNVALKSVATIGELVEAVIIRADYDLSCFGLNIIDEGLWPTLSNSLASGSPSNYGGLGEPKMDAALDRLRVAATPEKITAAMAEIQRLWNEYVPAVVLNSAPNKTIHVEKLHNLQPTSNSLVYFADAFLGK